MNYSFFCPKGNTYRTGRLREVFIMGTQCFKTLEDSKSTGNWVMERID